MAGRNSQARLLSRRRSASKNVSLTKPGGLTASGTRRKKRAGDERRGNDQQRLDRLPVAALHDARLLQEHEGPSGQGSRKRTTSAPAAGARTGARTSSRQKQRAPTSSAAGNSNSKNALPCGALRILVRVGPGRGRKRNRRCFPGCLSTHPWARAATAPPPARDPSPCAPPIYRSRARCSSPSCGRTDSWPAAPADRDRRKATDHVYVHALPCASNRRMLNWVQPLSWLMFCSQMSPKGEKTRAAFMVCIADGTAKNEEHRRSGREKRAPFLSTPQEQNTPAKKDHDRQQRLFREARDQPEEDGEVPGRQRFPAQGAQRHPPRPAPWRSAPASRS